MSDLPGSLGDATLVAMYRSCFGEDVKQDVARQFADRYMEKLVSLIQRNISGRFQSGFDAEDIAQSVMRSWFNGVKERKIHPTCSADIWSLISVIALNKVRNRIRAAKAQKRDASRTESGDDAMGELAEPGPGEELEIKELFELVLKDLDEQTGQVLRMMLDGFSIAEISEQLKVSTKTIQRRKKDIQAAFLKYLPEDMLAVAQAVSLSSDDNDTAA